MFVISYMFVLTFVEEEDDGRLGEGLVLQDLLKELKRFCQSVCGLVLVEYLQKLRARSVFQQYKYI